MEEIGTLAKLIDTYGISTVVLSLGVISVVYLLYTQKKNSEKKDVENKEFFNYYIKEKDESTEEWKAVAEKALQSFETLAQKSIENTERTIRVQESLYQKLSTLDEKVGGIGNSVVTKIKAEGLVITKS